MKKIAVALVCIFALAIAVEAQKKYKPWAEWSEKDVTKMLNDSQISLRHVRFWTDSLRDFSPATARSR